MVYVYSKQSQINKYIGKKLSVDEIEKSLKDMGMDIKGNDGNKDPELKIEITAEKADMVSTIGVARAIKYYLGIEKKIPNYKITKGKNEVLVKKSVKHIRPYTVCAIIKNIKITGEILNEIIEIQEKIHDSFGRRRKKAAIGIYPIENLKFPISYLAEKPDDIYFQPLESDKELKGSEIVKNLEIGKKFAHLLEDYDYYPMFKDSNGEVLSMPPIINSHKTGRVDLNHKDLLIEMTGYNITYLDNLLKILITTFQEMQSSIEVESIKVKYESGEEYELSLDNTEEEISLDYINKLIGINIKPNEIEKLLNKVMLGLKEIKGDKIIVEIPPFRSDIWHDSDIADDIARAYGYNNIVPTFPKISSVGKTLPFSDFKNRINQTLVSMGFLQLYTYMLTSKQTQFQNLNIEKPDINYTSIIDSETQGLNMIRVRILPEVLTSLHINRKNKYPQKVFETGYIILDDKKTDTKTKDISNSCVVIADPKANYTSIKEVFDMLCKLNNLDLKLKELTDCPFLIEGRSAEIFYKNKSVGFIGEIHPQVLENFGLLVPAVAFEITLDTLFE